MFKSNNKLSITEQLRKRFSFSTPSAGKGNVKNKQHERKMPRIPNSEEEELMQQSIKERMTLNNNEYINAYGAFFLEYSIAAEFNHLKKIKLPGVYVLPSFYDPLVWFGVIFIRQGIYQDGVFRFTLRVPSNYPDGDCPTISFTPAVFHPFINASTGELNLERAFGSWRPNVNHIWQILLYLRRIFYKFDSKDPVDKQAADLYENDVEGYKRKIHNVIADINNRLYEDVETDDPHAFRFSKWDKNTHGEVLKKVHTPKMDDDIRYDDFDKPKLSGLSFVEPGTSYIFSKER